MLHSVGAEVDWDGAVTAGHGTVVKFFAAVGIDLSDQVRRALLAHGHARGSDTHYAEVETEIFLTNAHLNLFANLFLSARTGSALHISVYVCLHGV